ncbi:MAG: diaminobutyrate--2-oxoglutarate transaminase [Clostridia bacterium]|nr:diaminobutyrate--2-oxoglutarate transaminase [Clostridia bacterium]
MNIFEILESNVRSYCRTFPDVFCAAKGSMMYSESGKEYIDFLSGAGALNYGHNNEFIKQRILTYISSDNIIHGLDIHTPAKREFIDKLSEIVLKPGNLNHKIQFCGPTGTNAVEAALKLARKVKKRTNVFAFMGSFHGMSLGSLSVSSNISDREGAGQPLGNVTFMPFPSGFMSNIDTIGYIEAILSDDHSGIEKPAAIILETVQGEGGVVEAPVEWLRNLRILCDRHEILLICDEIQTGCGRTGPFFSFQRAGIIPDMITVSKSISGIGLPMSLLLIKPELDIWKPAEHNGTFRGNQLAFVGGTAALELSKYENLQGQVKLKESFIKRYFEQEILPISKNLKVRGLGMMWGIDFSLFSRKDISKKIVSYCYENGLIIERAGRNGSVVKLMPALTVEIELLEKGCSIIKKAITEHINRRTILK